MSKATVADDRTCIVADFISFVLGWLRLAGVCAGDFTKQLEKTSFPIAADVPVDRHALVALLETLALHAKVEATPRRMLAHGGDEVVLRLVECEVVVLVEQNRLAVVAGHSPRLANHFRDPRGIGNAVAVHQKKIGGANDVCRWNGAAAVRRADQQ